MIRGPLSNPATTELGSLGIFSKAFEKVSKYQRLTHFFNKQLYIHNKFVTKSWVNRRHFFIDDKNLQKYGLTAMVLSV